uniref:XRE family transcriptional regulator n=1 Tax=Thermomicrobium roseum TaxID=500 RepID=A0A7C2B4Z5_THERO
MSATSGSSQTFAEVLRRERKRRGWTQAQLAERLQVRQSAISHWESGRERPALEHLLLLLLLFPDLLTTLTLEERRQLYNLTRVQRALATECLCSGCRCGASTAA